MEVHTDCQAKITLCPSINAARQFKPLESLQLRTWQMFGLVLLLPSLGFKPQEGTVANAELREKALLSMKIDHE